MPDEEYKLVNVTLEYSGKTWKFKIEDLGLTYNIVYIVLNCMKEPFNNPLVRQALAWAVPYKQIWSKVYNNLTKPLYGVIPSGMFGYTEDGLTKYDYNIDKAKELIQKSGIDPSKYTITLAYNQGNRAREQICTILQQTWSQLGFNVKVQSMPWATYVQWIEDPEKFDAYVIGWAPDYADPDDYAYPLFGGGYAFDDVSVLEVAGTPSLVEIFGIKTAVYRG